MSNKQQATSNKQQATSNKQQATNSIKRLFIALTAIILALSLTSCGGGGGGGGAVSSWHKAESGEIHNGGDASGWGKSPNSAPGFGGTDGGLGSGSSEIVITGSTPLEVSGYTYNGATYSDVQSLAKAVLESGTTDDIFYVDFNVEGESAPRTARIRANSAANPGDALTIDYQYKATYSIPSAAGAAATPQEVFYYKRDGITIELPELSNSNYATPDGDGIAYHANKWSVQGQTVSGGSVHINASGDVVIDDITPTADRTYGFSGTQVIVNDTGTVTINNTGRSGSITKVKLPASGSVALDLSGVTNLNLSGSSSSSPAIINKNTLSSVTLPESSYSLGDYAFSQCTNLSGSIDLSNCTSIGNYAFHYCNKLASVDLSNCSSIGVEAFSVCNSLTGSIDLSNCTSIGDSAFASCSKITSVVLPSSYTSIGEKLFRNCKKLSSIDLSNCTSIGDKAFDRCEALTSVNLSSCISIGENAFSGSGLTGAIDLSNITSIGNSAFNDCTGITSVDLSNCTSIEGYAFYGCTGITSVTFGSGLARVDTLAFGDVNASFVFNSDPTSISYGSSPFKVSVTAIWDDGTTVHNYRFNTNANVWLEY